jgi:hypothetical protein
MGLGRQRASHPVQGIIDNAEDFSGEEVAEMFELDVDVVKQILDFAAKR